MAAPAVLDSTEQTVTTSTAVACPKPTLVDGCTVLLIIGGRGSANVTTPPSGFLPVTDASGGSSSNASGARVAVFRRYVATASGEPATYDATMSTALHGNIHCLSITGADPTAPIHLALGESDIASNDPDVVCPSIETTTNDCLLIRNASMVVSLGIDSWSTSDCTEDEDGPAGVATNRLAMATGHEDHLTAGPTGTATWTAAMTGGHTTYGSAFGVTIAIVGPQVLANAGSNRSVNPGETAELDGSLSTGDIDTIEWTVSNVPVGATTPIIQDADQLEATLIAPAPPGDSSIAYTLQLEVTGPSNSDTDTMTVTVSPSSVPSLGIFFLNADGET